MSSLKQISQKSLKTDKNFHTETPSVYPKHIEITSQTHKINNQDEKDIEHTNKKNKNKKTCAADHPFPLITAPTPKINQSSSTQIQTSSFKGKIPASRGFERLLILRCAFPTL